MAHLNTNHAFGKAKLRIAGLLEILNFNEAQDANRRLARSVAYAEGRQPN